MRMSLVENVCSSYTNRNLKGSVDKASYRRDGHGAAATAAAAAVCGFVYFLLLLEMGILTFSPSAAKGLEAKW